MSDDTFFREVNEELRQDRARALWTRFGKWVIAAAVVAILLTAAYVAWDRYQTAQADASGDQYLAALNLAEAGDRQGAIAELEAIVQEGYGAYPVLARMRIATIHQAEGDPAAAVGAFDTVGADASAPQPLRDIAAIRAAYILVDSGTLEDVRQRVERLSGDADPTRFPAREALGLASWKAGELEDARRLFEQLRDDQGTPAGIAARARVMLDVIAVGGATGGIAGEAANEAAAPAPAAPQPSTDEAAAPSAPLAPPAPAEDTGAIPATPPAADALDPAPAAPAAAPASPPPGALPDAPQAQAAPAALPAPQPGAGNAAPAAPQAPQPAAPAANPPAPAQPLPPS